MQKDFDEQSCYVDTNEKKVQGKQILGLQVVA